MRLPSWIHWSNPPAEQQPASGGSSPAKAKQEPAAWRPMTPLELLAARALGFCYLPPASSTKRMVRHLVSQANESEPRITDKQAVYLWKFAWTYRRQIRDGVVLLEAAKRRAEEESRK